jgi:hypothetical protein
MKLSIGEAVENMHNAQIAARKARRVLDDAQADLIGAAMIAYQNGEIGPECFSLRLSKLPRSGAEASPPRRDVLATE